MKRSRRASHYITVTRARRMHYKLELIRACAGRSVGLSSLRVSYTALRYEVLGTKDEKHLGLLPFSFHVSVSNA